jgi:flagellar hook protein FlgE
VITARKPEDLKAFEGREGALILKLDVTDQAQVDAAVKAAEAHFGRIDVLLNNAGIGYFGSVEESEDAEVRRMFEINVFALGRMIRAVLPQMRKQRSGCVVNFSSMRGGRLSSVTVSGAAATALSVPATTASSSNTAFSISDPTSYTSTTSQTVYDSLGNPHTQSLYFVKTAQANKWDVYTSLDGGFPPEIDPITGLHSPTTVSTSRTLSRRGRKKKSLAAVFCSSGSRPSFTRCALRTMALCSA